MNNSIKRKKPGNLAVFIACVIVISILIVATVSAAGPSMNGNWVNLDTDGSIQSVSIGGNEATGVVHLRDDGASVCGLDNNGEPLYAINLHGKGPKAGNSVQATLAGHCMESPPVDFGPLILTFIYDPVTETLFDGFSTYHQRP